MARFLAHLCFFLSGFAALLYQVGWMKQLSALMGNTIFTLTTILMAFMTGLALGSFLVRFTKASQFLALPGYIVIEIMIGCYGISFLWIFKKMERFYQSFFLDQQFNFQAEMGYQFLICGVVIFFPTLLMGATLPLLAEFLYRKNRSFTKDFGQLYAVNSYGAFLGTITCGYILLPLIGYQNTVNIAAAINFFVAFLAYLLLKLPDKKKKILKEKEKNYQEAFTNQDNEDLLTNESEKNNFSAKKISKKKKKKKQSNQEEENINETTQLEITAEAVLHKKNEPVDEEIANRPLRRPSKRTFAELTEYDDFPFSMVCTLLFTSGFLGMSLQVAWNRLLGITLGGSTYTFTMIAACIILGIACGSHLITHLASKRKITPNLTVGLVLLASFAAYFSSYLMTYFPIVIGRLNIFLNNYVGTGDINSVEVLHKFIISEACKFIAITITLLPATCLLGGIFPLTTALYNAKQETVRKNVGFAYFINMLGVILGTGISGYILLPSIGFEKTIRFNLVVGCFAAYALVHFSPQFKSKANQWLTSIGILYLLGFTIWATPFYNYHMLTSSYFYNRAELPSETKLRLKGYPNYSEFMKEKHKMIFLEEDAVGLITGHESHSSKARWFKVNGKVDGSTSNESKGGDVADCKIIATAGFLFEPNSKNVLTIGLGLGITHGMVLKFPVEQATVVEISESVSRLAQRYFETFNNKFWEKENSTVKIQDGRQFLKLNSKQWDIIICEPSNPWMSGVSSLFTLEFYQLVKQRLVDNGIAILWFHAYGLDKDSICSVLKSMSQVFPNNIVLKGPSDSDIYFIARNGTRPLQIQEKQLKTFYKTQLTEILKVYQASDLKDLMKKFVFLDSSLLAEHIKEATPNTDDNMILEFSSGLYFNAKMNPPKLASEELLTFKLNSKYHDSLAAGKFPRFNKEDQQSFEETIVALEKNYFDKIAIRKKQGKEVWFFKLNNKFYLFKKAKKQLLLYENRYVSSKNYDEFFR